jgi:hypothetical protein
MEVASDLWDETTIDVMNSKTAQWLIGYHNLIKKRSSCLILSLHIDFLKNLFYIDW